MTAALALDAMYAPVQAVLQDVPRAVRVEVVTAYEGEGLDRFAEVYFLAIA